MPNFANSQSTLAQGEWTTVGFSGAVTFKNPDKSPYTIKSQSLVGGTVIACTSGITLSNTGSAN